MQEEKAKNEVETSSKEDKVDDGSKEEDSANEGNIEGSDYFAEGGGASGTSL